MTINNKVIAILAVVIVVAAAAAAVVMVTNNGPADNSTATGRLMVYGNANNDDYLDSKDVEFVKKIAKGEETWNRNTNPYADANHDNIVNNEDVTYLENLIKGNSASPTKMYYRTYSNTVDYVNFPITGKIGVNYVYGLQICQTLGVYDRVSAAVDSVISGYEEAFYPGLKSMDNLGSDSDKATFLDNIIAKGVTTIVGFDDMDLTALAHGSGKNINVLNLPFARYGGNVSPLCSVMISGALFGELDQAREFAGYFDRVYSYVNSHVKDIPTTYTSALIFNPSSPTTVNCDTYGSNGTMMGDTWVVYQLPIKDVADHTRGEYVSMQVDSANITDADYLFITLGMTALKIDTSIADGQAVFNEKCELLKGTKAYQNKHIIGVGFVPIGTYLGISELGLLANAIWSGSFDDAEGYKLLEECYTKFAHVPENYDFASSGYFHVYTQQ